MADVSDNNVLVGSKVLIRMDGNVVGFAQSARCTDNYRYIPIHIMGQLQAVEYVPTTAMHEIVLTSMVMRNDSLTRHNLEPWGAGSYGYVSTSGDNIGGIKGRTGTYKKFTQNLTTTKDAQPNGGTLTLIDNSRITIGITDAATGKNIVQYEKCFYAAGGFSISANNIIGHQVTFYSILKVGQLDALGDTGIASGWQAAQYT